MTTSATLDPIDEFVHEQLASGRFSDYEALVRYAIASLKDRQSEIDEVAEELRPAIESMQRGEPGFIMDFESIHWQQVMPAVCWTALAGTDLVNLWFRIAQGSVQPAVSLGIGADCIALS